MSITAKGRRRIVVGDKTYIWYVALDDDSPYHILHVASEDKRLILACPLRTGTAYVISKGRIFQTKASKCWNRYLLPFEIPEIITSKFVAQLIVWSTQNTDAVPVGSNQVPV